MLNGAGMGRWEKIERVLCVRFGTAGDVSTASPAIRALKESRPGRRITLLTAPGALQAGLTTEITGTISYEAPWMKGSALRRDSRPEREIAERLRQARFEAAVIFTAFDESPLPSAFLCYLAEIPLRLAYCRENPHHLLTDWLAEPCPPRDEAQRHLDLVASVVSMPFLPA